MEKAKGQHILLDPDELPTMRSLRDAAKRLKKDAELLTRLPSGKDVDPKILSRVADFLEHLTETYKRQFPKGDKRDDQVEEPTTI